MTKKRGRPSKIDTISLDKLKRLASFGLTDKQLSQFFEINEDTLNTYKKRPEFSESLKRGKDVYDNQVEEALRLRALGYEHEEMKVFCDKGRIITCKVTKHYPPDPTSMIFWLKNRRPESWKDKHEIGGELSHKHFLVALIERAKNINGYKDGANTTHGSRLN